MNVVAETFSAQERDALVVLGYLHLEQSRADEAAALLRPLHRQRPHDREVERCLAVAELRCGEFERAARLAAHAYTHAPAEVRTAMGLIYARALWLGGDESSARDVLLKVLAQKAATP